MGEQLVGPSLSLEGACPCQQPSTCSRVIAYALHEPILGSERLSFYPWQIQSALGGSPGAPSKGTSCVRPRAERFAIGQIADGVIFLWRPHPNISLQTRNMCVPSFSATTPLCTPGHSKRRVVIRRRTAVVWLYIPPSWLNYRASRSTQ